MRNYSLSPNKKKLLFLLAVLLLCFGGWKGYSLLIRLAFQQALDSFDPETTEFTISYWHDAHFTSGEKTQDQLTPEQRLMVLQYLESLQFQKVYLKDPRAQVDGGSSFHIIYETPQGKLFVGSFSQFRMNYGVTFYIEYEDDDNLYEKLRDITIIEDISQ